MDYNAQVTVRRTRFTNEATGWAVVEAIDEAGEEVVLVGPLHHLEERERAHVVGIWEDDSRFGPQVKVAQADPLPPSDEQALLAYLVRVRHIGPRRAAKLLERHGEEGVLEAIDRDPGRAFMRAGLSGHRAREAAQSWDALRVTRRLHLLLAPHGLAYLVTGIQREFGDAAHRIVRERPYELTSVFGVGFGVADRIAGTAGIPRDSPERARAGILHVLSEAERSGSTCLPLATLITGCGELLGMEAPSQAFVDDLVSRGDLERAGEWIYRAETARLEAELAELIRALLDSPSSRRLREPPPEPARKAVAVESASADSTSSAPDPPLAPESKTELPMESASADSTLSDEQWTGVRAAFSERLSLITGGPGTGKTASIRTIGTLAAAQRARILLVAPTGRAAVRMTEATGIRASTVHSALGWIPGEGPTHDEDDPLGCDLLIVDETSMANLELMLTLLRAVGEDTNVVLVGDADQLAPVGAGKPFAELVASGLVPTARLTHIFRQAAGSMIVQGAHAIRRGEAPDFVARGDMRRDLFLIERSDPAAARREIIELVSRRLPAHYGIDPITDIQVFAPVYRGELGIDRLNEALREALNPDGAPVRGGRLRLGDKLMLTGRNLHDLGLMNGTLLRLIDEVTAADAEEDEEAALVLAAEEAIFRLPPEDAERLKLAYACSVHRGQGIELPVAVIVAHQAAGAFFLRREMLYTAITRSKLATVIVGTRDVLARAARTPDTGRRHGRLTERLVPAG